ncbi:class I SAM-dependent methyltransferase [Qipengyuania algicida]|nr:SAM-dependent methyltransferase [Qipengyuania algicida]
MQQDNEQSGDLAARFRRLIRNHGPLPVTRYMGESNAHYYATRDPLGSGGDFVTAPEISQMFGEFVGLWLVDVWSRASPPVEPIYVELGPGRGTLARDILRTVKRFGLEPQVHLVEGSPALRDIQSSTVPGAQFHDSLDTVPRDAPWLLVANEFLDALPIHQLVKTVSGWRERMVALDGEEFAFIAGPQPLDAVVPDVFGRDPPGTVIETSPAAAAILRDVAQHLADKGGAGLWIDYGHLKPRTGSTMQAVRAHQKVDALAMPGEADLTAHVDFASLVLIARGEGTKVQTTTQGEWLVRLGLNIRAEKLKASAPDKAEEVEAARHRLTDPEEMGELFKVMALTGTGWPEGAGFTDEGQPADA